MCQEHSIAIHGIIDSDYYGNTDVIAGIPIIDTEEVFADLEKLDYYKNNFNFFCATNWIPLRDPVSKRNKEKRFRLIELIKTHNLPCISLIEKDSKVSRYATIGYNVYLDYLVLISPDVTVGDFTCMYNRASIGHHTVIGENCVIQADCIVMSECVLEDNIYLGTSVRLLKPKTKIAHGTFIHEMVYLRKNTQPNQVVTIFDSILKNKGSK